MGWKDDISANDFVEVGLSRVAVPPVHPCPICKKESKDSGTLGWRICCGSKIYVGLSEQQHLDLLAELQGVKDRVVELNAMYKKADTELTAALRTLRERGII